MSFNMALSRNSARGNELSGAYPNGDGPARVYGIELAWDLPTQYTDTSKYFPNTYKIEYGTSTGVYDTVVDMSTDDDPAMLSKQITGLNEGTTYYCVVKAVDSEGYESAVSSEVALVAAEIPPATDPTVYTEIRQADIPYTISTSGNYRIMENLDYDVNQGVGITIAADDVVLFARSEDNIVFTTCTTNDVSGVGFSGTCTNVEIYGFHITHNGHLTTSAYTHGPIHLDNLGHSVYNLDIHDMELTIGEPNQNMTGSSTAFGCITINSPGHIDGKIHDCVFNMRGSKSDSGTRGVSHSGGDASTRLVAYNNVVNCSDVSGTAMGYHRPFIGVHEVHNNTINVTDCSYTLFGVTGILDAEYSHNNTFNITNSNAIRAVIVENDRANAVHLYNTLNVISGNTANPDVDIRLNRVRFGANGTVIGFNTYNGNGEAKALGLLDLYGDEDADLTRETYLYNSTVTGSRNGLVNISEQAEDTYLWGNTADSTNRYGLYLRSRILGDNANGFYTDGDDVNGSTADVALVTDPSPTYPACENTHLAGLGAITIDHVNSSSSTIQETHYWLDGDAGLITHTQKNTGSKTPTAPANVRAA